MPRGAGRPSKLTRRRRELICDLVREGDPPSVAAVASGIDRSTYCLWMSLGRSDAEEHKKYRIFRRAIRKAEREAESRLRARVTEASKKYWLAAAWILERRFPKNYAAKPKTVIMNKIAPADMSDEELRKEAEKVINGKPRTPPDRPEGS